MSLLGALVTGAGVDTTFAGQAQCEQFILIGDVDTTCPLRGIQIMIGGKSVINITGSQPLVNAFMKFMMNLTASTIGLLFKVSCGKINKATTYRFTNDGATTPNIYAYSQDERADLAVPVEASMVGINANSYDTFSKFTALLITSSANVSSIDILFADGNKNNFSMVEIDAMFATYNQAEANGRLDAVVSTIDNRFGNIESVQINCSAAVTVVVIKVPDVAFKNLRAIASGKAA